MMSKKELEEKRRKEEYEAAHVFEDFLKTFQATPAQTVPTNTWIKAGIYDSGQIQQTETSNVVYQPVSKVKLQNKEILNAQQCARILPVDKKADSIKKSNLATFKEELKLLQKDREIRSKFKNEIKLMNSGIERGDPTSTNLYVYNLNINISEEELIDLFGQFGPLASIKLMYPRTEEEKARPRSNGFVAYMSRKDAERSLKHLNNLFLLDTEIKLNWGKPITIPKHPLYIPPIMEEYLKPPPNSGLPFNAQPPKFIQPTENFEEYLKHCVVKVVIPTNRKILGLIHRMIEFVVQEGTIFEAMIMSQQINNPSFEFLFNNKSNEHVYYRWKLFSIMHGESVDNWSTKPFRMFENGSIWKPPTKYDFTQGMPDELFTNIGNNKMLRKNLSPTQRENLEHLIRNLTPERSKIAEITVFCINHLDTHDEIADCISQSLHTKSLCIHKIIARLYAVSDILSNSKKSDCYGKSFEKHLELIMKRMGEVYKCLTNADRKIFHARITRILNAWSINQIYPQQYVKGLYKQFIAVSETSENKNDIQVNCSKVTEDVQKENKAPRKNVSNLIGFVKRQLETAKPEVVSTNDWKQRVIEKDEKNILKSRFRDISECKRQKLREIEVEVMKYQDELEDKSLSPKKISRKVENYRKSLIDEYEYQNSKRRKGEDSSRSRK